MNLSVTVGGITLKNPLILGSASYTQTAKGMELYIQKGYGAIVTKTVTMKALEGSPAPRAFWYDPEEKTMFSGAEALRNPGMDSVTKAVAEVRKLAEAQNCKIVGSIAGNSVEEMQTVAKAMEEAGVDIIEINMVCPSTGPHLGPDYACLGKYWSANPDRAVEAISGIRSVVRVPIWAKCTLGSLTSPGFLERVDRDARPDAYSFVGGRLPCLVIDVETGKPKFPGNTQLMIDKQIPISPTVTGPVKASTMLHTAYLARLTTTPLIPSGGLRRGHDIIEALMVGAAAAQISQAVYRDRDVSLAIIREMEAFVERRALSSLGEIAGVALQYIPKPPLLKVPIVS